MKKKIKDRSSGQRLDFRSPFSGIVGDFRAAPKIDQSQDDEKAHVIYLMLHNIINQCNI